MEPRVVALAVTGSIAAYKAVEVARLLLAAGRRVLPLMTTSATRFVGPTTLSGICGEPVATSMWDPSYPGEMHVRIADAADHFDLFIAPRAPQAETHALAIRLQRDDLGGDVVADLEHGFR